MKIAQNMEALFVAAAILACSATYATAATAVTPTVQASAQVAVPSITITAKRLTAAEKAGMTAVAVQDSIAAGLVGRFSI